MTKTIYLFDPDTGVLAGESAHPLDPVETERAGKPVYALLNPALATETKPPLLPPGMTARMVAGTWTLERLPAPPEPGRATAPPASPEPPPPSLEERLASMRAAVQEYLDSMARALGYDDIRTAVTYAEEDSVPKFQLEAKALRAWRSLVWAACYSLLDAVEAGTTEEPAQEEIVALLPRFVVPPPATTETTQ